MDDVLFVDESSFDVSIIDKFCDAAECGAVGVDVLPRVSVNMEEEVRPIKSQIFGCKYGALSPDALPRFVALSLARGFSVAVFVLDEEVY